MRKFIVFPDSKLIGPGSKDELTPLTAAEFQQYDHWTVANDLSYDQFLYHNHFHDLERYNSDALRIGKIVLESGEPEIDWAVSYGDHNSNIKCEKCRSYK